jgi:hypothetical protein
MKKTHYIFMVTSLLMAMSVSAHVGLESSMPSENEVLSNSPEHLSLTFTGQVRLVKLELVNVESELAVDLDFKPTADAKDSFKITLTELKAGEYAVFWTVLGNDGHKMSDTFNFTLSECESDKSAHEDKESNQEHDNN